MHDIFYGAFCTIAGALVMIYAYKLGMIAERNHRDFKYNQDVEYAKELVKFYDLLYGEEEPPAGVAPPRTLKELKEVNKILETKIKVS